jgi:hypothetical protein
MGRQFTKVLVVPAGASEALREVLPGMRIQLLEYETQGRKIRFDTKALLAAIEQ